MASKTTPKAEETGLKILESAMALFRQEGFDSATMRDIAEAAGVATGAAYYYYPSKDAIVMDFYQRSSEEMQPKIEMALEHARGLEARLCELIQVSSITSRSTGDSYGFSSETARTRSTRFRRSAHKRQRSGKSISPGFAASWWIAVCGFRAT